MRAGDLKTIHWSTAMVSWSPSFWMVMSPPKNRSENGDTSVQSYRKIWGRGERDAAITQAQEYCDKHADAQWQRAGIIMTHCAQQLFCGVDWKCPISEERLCKFKMCSSAFTVRNVILPCVWISLMCYTHFSFIFISVLNWQMLMQSTLMIDPQFEK